MIKIIKKPKNKKHKLECNCGCIFTFRDKDIRHQNLVCGDDYYIYCPYCEERIDLSVEFIKEKRTKE